MKTFSTAARVSGVLPVLVVTLFLSGCGAGEAVSTVREIMRAGQQMRQIQQQTGALPMTDVTTGDAAPLAADEAVIKLALEQNEILPKIAPSNSGLGLVVCEPILSSAQVGSTPDAGAANFGAGCGRWLHFSVAGLPQFGKTPSWYGFDYALREMGKSDGRINSKEAAQLAKILAVTHIATGELKSAQASGILTYRLWKMPEQKEVGAPIVLRGNRTQILAGLPSVAKSLATRLKGDATLLPTKVEVSVQELETIGRAPRQAGDNLDDGISQPLKNLAMRSPLAAMEYVPQLFALNEDEDDSNLAAEMEKVTRTMLTLSSKNTLALAQAALLTSQVLETSSSRKSLASNFPNNYLVAYSEAARHAQSENRIAQKQAALRAIAASPQSAWAWLQLDTVIGAEANDVRRARYSNRMTTAEQRTVSMLYPQMTQACRQAIRCDPLNSEAWQRLSYAAATMSEDDLAEAALWKAIALPSRDDSTFFRGLELFQPKWQGDISKLARVARMIVADKERFLRMYWDVTEAFKDSGWKVQAAQFEKLAFKAHEDWLADHPRDYRNRYAYANMLRNRGDTTSAKQQFETLVQQQPKKTNALHGLAAIAEDQRHWKVALQDFQKVLALDPKDGVALFRCGQVYHEMRQFNKAEPLYRKTIALYPDYPDPYNRLGDLYYFVKNDKKGAEKLYRKAIELDPEDKMYRTNLERCLAS